MTGRPSLSNARITVLALLDKRAVDATICPSEVARSLAKAIPSPDWRSFMPAVHTAIDELMAEGTVQLSWKGKSLKKRAGPYRISWRRDL
jgi:hypothetical protein